MASSVANSASTNGSGSELDRGHRVILGLLRSMIELLDLSIGFPLLDPTVHPRCFALWQIENGCQGAASPGPLVSCMLFVLWL